jgi:hypothetical protein
MNNENKVTVLGLNFYSEEERRIYFHEEPHEKLPYLKKMGVFFISEAEGILNLNK